MPQRNHWNVPAAHGSIQFIILGPATGARRGELLALQWADLDFKTGIMNASKSVEQTKASLRIKTTKSEKPRRFAVPVAALDAFREHRTQQGGDRAMFGADYEENDLVFSRPEGNYYSPDRICARVVELVTKCGIEGVSLDSLHHTHASELISKGVPITTVAKRLGHANANITLSIYAHALEADELAAAKIWDAAMADVIGVYKRHPERMLTNVSAEGAKKMEVDEKKGRRMAGTTGLEPATSDVTGRRSNQLNYVPALCGRSQCSTHTTFDHAMHKKHRPHRPEYTDARRPALIQIHAPVGRANLVLIFKGGLQ